MTSSPTAPPAPPKGTPAAAGPRRRSRSGGSRRQLSDTAKYARLSSISGVLFAALATVGLYLIPFAGIVFLWHAHCTRLLIETRTAAPSAIPYGLQLVSGVLFVVLLFAGTASAGAVALLKDLTSAPLPSADFVRGMLAVGYGMVFVYALRGAGMYALTTTTLLRQAGIMPKWVGLVSYLLAAFLLLSTVMHPAAMLIFPTWVVIASLVIFIRAGRVAEPATPERQSA